MSSHMTNLNSESRCPTCGQRLEQHRFWDIGSAELGTSSDRELAAFISQEDWQKAQSCQAANLPADIRVWRAVQCPDGRTNIIPVILKYEIWDDDDYGPAQQLSSPKYS